MGAEQSSQLGGIVGDEGLICCRAAPKDAAKRGDHGPSRREPAPAPVRDWREERMIRLQQEAELNKARLQTLNGVLEDEANSPHFGGHRHVPGEQHAALSRFVPADQSKLYSSSRSQSLSASTHRSSSASPPEADASSALRTHSVPVADVLSPRSPRPFANPHQAYPVDFASPRSQRGEYVKPLPHGGAFGLSDPMKSPRQVPGLSPRRGLNFHGAVKASNLYNTVPTFKGTVYDFQTPVTHETEECLL